VRISEVFLSLEGEGINAGEPTVFVRLQGCNLVTTNPCKWCDTKYAQEGLGEYYTPTDIVDEIVKLSPATGTRLCITGCEPLFQSAELELLCARLNRFNYYIECFSNGTLPKPIWWTRVNSWIIDYKMPSSGVTLPFNEDWLELRATDQFKLTVGSQEDLQVASEMIKRLAFTNAHIIVSPVISVSFDSLRWGEEREWLQTVAEFCIKTGTRYSLQLQKVIWGNKKGV